MLDRGGHVACIGLGPRPSVREISFDWPGHDHLTLVGERICGLAGGKLECRQLDGDRKPAEPITELGDLQEFAAEGIYACGIHGDGSVDCLVYAFQREPPEHLKIAGVTGATARARFGLWVRAHRRRGARLLGDRERRVVALPRDRREADHRAVRRHELRRRQSVRVRGRR